MSAEQVALVWTVITAIGFGFNAKCFVDALIYLRRVEATGIDGYVQAIARGRTRAEGANTLVQLLFLLCGVIALVEIHLVIIAPLGIAGVLVLVVDSMMASRARTHLISLIARELPDARSAPPD